MDDRKVLLLVDIWPAHPKHNEVLRNAGIVRALKMHYCRRFYRTFLKGYKISTQNPEKINILDALNLAISAWTTDIQARIIVNYFRHCKTSVHQYREFREFESTIGRIQQLQIVIKELSYRNTMDVEYILNYP